MKEKTFNTVFNIVLLVGMLLAVSISTAFKLSDPAADRVMLLVAAAGAVMGVVNTVLSANGRILTFLFGFLDVCIYSYVCWRNGVYGQFALHAFFFLPMQFVGFFQWRRRGADTAHQVKARRFNRKQWIMFISAVVAGLAVAVAILSRVERLSGGEPDRVKILADSAALVFNILGQILLSLAFAEQWICWILVNIFSVTIWVHALAVDPSSSSATVMLLKYGFYFLNSLNGLRIWMKLSREEVPDEVAIG